MTILYLDIREKSLTALIQKGSETCYRNHFILEGFDGLNEKIKQALTESGTRPDTAHIIIPPSEVITETITLQNMPVEYAEMIIRRKIMTEKGIKSPLIHLTPLRAEGAQQTYLIEAVEKDAVEKYIKALSLHKIKIKTITTSFQANIEAFKGIGKDVRTLGILDLDENLMEFTIIRDSAPIIYERISFQKPDKEEVEEKPQDRLDRIALFKIAEKFHNIYRRIKNILVDQTLSKVFLFGPYCSSKELIEVLSEITEIGVPEEEDLCLYSTIKGLVMGVPGKSIANFLESKKSFSDLIRRYRRFAFAVMIAYLVLLFSGYLYVENKYRKANQRFALVTKAMSQKATGVNPVEQMKILKGISEKDIPIYEVMGYLSNNLPDNVFLESLNYAGKDDRTTMALVFIIKDLKGMGRDALLTKLLRTLDNSVYLRKHSEPSLSILTRDKDRILQVSVTVEVN